MSSFVDWLGTLASTFRIGKATLDSSGLTATRSYALPDASTRASATALGSQASTITLDLALNNDFSVTLGGNANFAAPANLSGAAKQSGFITVTQDGSGGRVPTYNIAWKPAGGTAPTLSTAAGAVDLLWYRVNDAGTAIVFGLAAKGVA